MDYFKKNMLIVLRLNFKKQTSSNMHTNVLTNKQKLQMKNAVKKLMIAIVEEA